MSVQKQIRDLKLSLLVTDAEKYPSAKILLSGTSGSGKTASGLVILTELGCKNIIVIDSEGGRSRDYVDKFRFKVIPIPPTNQSPQMYAAAVMVAVDNGADGILIDSVSHAWEGAQGLMEQKDKAGQHFGAWNKVRPQETALWNTILGANVHTVVTCRENGDWQEGVDDNGRKKWEKIGLKLQQRKGIEFEFTFHFKMGSASHYGSGGYIAQVMKCSTFGGVDVSSGDLINARLVKDIKDWLEGGEEGSYTEYRDENAALGARFEELATKYNKDNPSSVVALDVWKNKTNQDIANLLNRLEKALAKPKTPELEG